MSKNNLIPDRSLIQACVLRSKYILMAQSALHASKEMEFFVNRLPSTSLTAKDSIKELRGQIELKIDEWKRDIARYIKPLYHAENIRIVDPQSKDNKEGDKYWFSSIELKDGYVQLSTRDMEDYFIHNRILLLSDVQVESKTYPAGSIISWELFNTISDFIDGVIDDKTFVVHYAMRKMKKNGKTEN